MREWRDARGQEQRVTVGGAASGCSAARGKARSGWGVRAEWAAERLGCGGVPGPEGGEVRTGGGRPGAGSGRAERRSGKERGGKKRKEEKRRRKWKKGKEKEKEGEGEKERFAASLSAATTTPVGHARLSRPRAVAFGGKWHARIEGNRGMEWRLDSGVGTGERFWELGFRF